MEVFQDFFRRQEDFVRREVQGQDPASLPPCPAMTGSVALWPVNNRLGWTAGNYRDVIHLPKSGTYHGPYGRPAAAAVLMLTGPEGPRFQT